MTDLHIIESPLDSDVSKTNFVLQYERRGWPIHVNGKHWAICLAGKAVFYHPWSVILTGSYPFASEEEAHAAIRELGWAR